MTDTRHKQPRCAICGRIQRPAWCGPTACYFGPLHALAPTLENVDAELAPKGLLALAWDRKEPAWLGDWFTSPRDRELGTRVRMLVVEAKAGHYMPNTRIASVWRSIDGMWRASAPNPSGWYDDSAGHPTPEAAQQACEAAIVAAWRNR